MSCVSSRCLIKPCGARWTCFCSKKVRMDVDEYKLGNGMLDILLLQSGPWNPASQIHSSPVPHVPRPLQELGQWAKVTNTSKQKIRNQNTTMLSLKLPKLETILKFFNYWNCSVYREMGFNWSNRSLYGFDWAITKLWPTTRRRKSQCDSSG